ncbi:MAG: (2Fe-2S) ferredoxin domain-containing protein [Aquificota bacterium]|nr:MAG: (2Fe-2S) ferredoxin domain-containing protein [Aquificota bacterium]
MAKIRTLEDLRKIREKAKKIVDLREMEGKEFRVIIPMGTSGIAAGARDILKAFLDVIEEKDLHNVVVTQTGFMGTDPIQPVALVEDKEGNKVMYCNLTPEKVREIVEKHIMKGEVVREYVVAVPLEE